MTRDEVQIRSEGALQATETALARITHLLSAPDWVMQVRAQTAMPERIDDAMSFAGLMFAWRGEPGWLTAAAFIALVAWLTFRR